LLQLTPISITLQGLQGKPTSDLLQARLLQGVQDTTASRYVQALVTFFADLDGLGVAMQHMTQADIADVLLVAKEATPGEAGAGLQSNMMKALRWAHKLLCFDPFPDLYGGILSSSLDRLRGPKKEAVPLAVQFLIYLEEVVLDVTAASSARLDAGSFLLAAWGSLRFSDMQHLALRTCTFDGSCLRGTVYRSKAASRGMPVGISGGGFHGRQPFHCWLSHFLALLGEQVEQLQQQCGVGAVPNYVFGCVQQDSYVPLRYSEALRKLRDFLRSWRVMTEEQVGVFTLHSCKVSFLSYCNQLDLPQNWRAQQGHHVFNASVQLYGRDDVIFSLRAQQTVQREVQKGWRPWTAQLRGGAQPIQEGAEPLRKNLPVLRAVVPFFTLLEPVTEPAVSGPSLPDPEQTSELSSGSARPLEAPRVHMREGTGVAEGVAADESPSEGEELGAADEYTLVRSRKGTVLHVMGADGAPVCGVLAAEWYPVAEPDPSHRMCKHKACFAKLQQ
jgi:hypothetical protein